MVAVVEMEVLVVDALHAQLGAVGAIALLDGDDDSTIADLIASPVGSWQTNDGPRSTKTAPHSPRTSVRMNAIGGDAARHAASTASARSSGASTATTTWYCARPSIGKAPASAPTFTPGLSSCICRAHASARFFPSSAGVR